MLHSSHLKGFAVACLLGLTQLISAQTMVTVEGTVKDADGQPVIGAYVIEKGTLNGTTTNINGNYKLTVPANAVIAAECIGYASVDFKVVQSGSHNFILEEDALFLDDVVVVGYSTTTKRDLISSVSQVKTEQIVNLPTTNIAQGLAGRSPGLIVVASGGGINKAPSISIRGGGTPLYVIDGVIRAESDFVALSPDDIEQMNVLKDASATAIYGSRAANGIIQVVTKTGQKGKVSVDYDYNQSFQSYTWWPNPIPLYEQYQYANQGSINDNLDPDYNDDAIQAAKEMKGTSGQPLQSARDLFLKKWAPQSKHTVRFNAGNDVARTYASISNVFQDSNFKTVRYDMNRTNFRLAENISLKKIGLQLTAALDGYVMLHQEPRSQGGGNISTIISGFMDGDVDCFINEWGNPTFNGTQKQFAEGSGYYKNNVSVVNARGEAIWNIPWVKGLKLRASTNRRYYYSDTKSWEISAVTYDAITNDKIISMPPSLRLNFKKNVGWTNQAFVEYANQFGKHSLQAVAGFEQYYESGYNYNLARTDYEFELDQISAGPAGNQTNSGNEDELGRAAWIGQFRYNYANKYYAEASIRYDGSDYFAEGNRWGAFLGGSLGWIVTGEKWMQPLVDKNILNLLKLRASYGQTGLDSSAGRFAYMQSYTLESRAYVIDGEYAAGFTEGPLPSPDLTWYTTTQTDLGFDFASLKNRLYGSFDYFYYKTFGYLVAPTGQSYLNQIMGLSMPKIKSDSEYRREGIEVQLGWRNTHGDFHYDISGNVTYFDQLWAYDQSEAESSYMNPFIRNQQQKDYYGLGLFNDGFYQNQDDVFNSVAFLSAMNSGYLAPGDIKYVDANGDGLIDENDGRRIGKSGVPRCQFGVNINLGWRGFAFSTLIQGSSKVNMYMGGTQQMKTWQRGPLLTAYEYQKDTWTPTNPNAKYPRLVYNTNLNSNNNFLTNDFWLLDCQYIRVKDLQFSYDFKYSVLKNVNWLAKLRLGISGQNVFTASTSLKYGMDPESNGAEGYNYPVQKVWAFTLNVGF